MRVCNLFGRGAEVANATIPIQGLLNDRAMSEGPRPSPVLMDHLASPNKASGSYLLCVRFEFDKLSVA